MIFVLKVTTNKEDQTIEVIADQVKKKNLPVKSLVHPHGLRGYIIIEAETRKDAEEAFHNISYAKGLLRKKITFDEMKHMLEPATKTVKIEKDDIVEIIAEPFKKEKAKVVRVDKTKEEVVVELLEAAVPIPITRKIDDVKVIRREEAEEEKNTQEEDEEEFTF